MVIKPQDVLLALQLSLLRPRLSYAALGEAVGLSASEAHAGVRRLGEARLLDPETLQVRREALQNFLVHGVPYVFPASPKEITRGVPTAWAVSPLRERLAAGESLPPVWPHPQGAVRGIAVEPLHKAVPGAALADPALHERLALVDALRLGDARQRREARELLLPLLASADGAS